MNRLSNLCLDGIDAPSTVFWHTRVQLDFRCLLSGQPPATQWDNDRGQY